MTLIFMKMKLHAGLISYEWFCTLTRFETEAQENSETAYYNKHVYIILVNSQLPLLHF